MTSFSHEVDPVIAVSYNIPVVLSTLAVYHRYSRRFGKLFETQIPE